MTKGNQPKVRAWIAEIDYKGDLDSDFDSELEEVAGNFGGHRAGSSYFFPTSRREVSWWFSTKEKAERFINHIKRVGRWASRCRKRIYRGPK